MSDILKRLKLSSPPKSEIQADPAGHADRVKSEKTISPKEIKVIEPQQPESRKAKPTKKLDLNQILLKLESMNEKDFPAYRTILKQYHTYQKKAMIEELVSFINNEIL